MKTLNKIYTLVLNSIKWVFFRLIYLFWVIILFPIKWIPWTYQRHCLAGYFVGFVSLGTSMQVFELHWLLDTLIALGATIFIGYAIEVIQLVTGKGVFEHKDAWAVVYGGAVIIIAAQLFILFQYLYFAL
jgi:hypothetical protein